MEILVTVLLSFVIMGAVIGAMAVGVMAGREPIKGSCGGLNSSGSCELCGGEPDRCREG